ncbi:MAG TPA: MlaD family protein [Puia sp.]|jgi:phospholipid/cholesterol/gamma-HCH transport system substrate-binding protein|nr:MlaD family protein [Puia sp.]
MSETNNRRKVGVGLFILLGLAILLTGVMVIGAQHKAFTKSIRLNVVFDDVNGLQAGNNVWLSGMKVGTVRKVSFYGRSQVEVILNIERDAQPHIRKDAKAQISTDGLVGNKIVVLTGGSDSAPVVADNDRLLSQQQAGLGEMMGKLQGMMGTLQESNGNLLAITGNLKTISEKLKTGQGSLGELLNDPSFAEALRGSLGNLRAATATTEKMAGNLEDFSSRLQHSTGLVNRLIDDTTVFQKLETAMEQVSAATTALRTAGNGLNDPHSPVGVMLHDEDAADNLQRTIKNLRLSSQELADDLEAIQHSFLLKGFFKKKKQ